MSSMSKNWLSRVMALILAVVMALGLLTGCGEGLDEKDTTAAPEQTTPGEEVTDVPTEAPKVEISYPLEGEAAISWWSSSGPVLYSSYTEASESPFHMGLNKMVGVDIDWRFVTIGGSAKTDYNLMLQDEELPTIMLGPVIDVEGLYEDGRIYDLTDYLPEYAPDYWAYLNDNNLIDEVKSLDGRILTVNSFRNVEIDSTVQGTIIRQDWLEECGLDIPVTLADWENVLTTFKDKYDAVLIGSKASFFLLMSGFASGAGAMGGINGLEFFVDDSGKVQCSQSQEEWFELIRIMARWFEKGLISPDYASVKQKQSLALAVDGKVGAMVVNDASFSTVRAAFKNTDAKWIAVPYAVTAPGEKVCFTRYRVPVNSDVCVITKSSTEEELITALKVLNYGFTEEGMHYWNFGEENVTFYYDENGKEQWTDLILNDSEGVANATKKYIGAYGAGPTCVDDWQVSIRTGADVVEAMRLWGANTDFHDHRIPTLKYTTDEEDQMADLVTTLETYMVAMAQKWLNGQESLDKFDEYLSEMETMGLNDVLAIMQQVYDRQTGK